MVVYLVRHAHAGHRSGWPGSDHDRPLSHRGRRQADELRKALADVDIERVYTSPAARCVETVEPLAEALGLKVRTRPELAEGADAEAAVAFALARAERNPVLCSHGDLIPKVIRRLLAAGMRTDDDNQSAKGSVWMLEVDDGRVTRGRYLPPTS